MVLVFEIDMGGGREAGWDRRAKRRVMRRKGR